MIARIAGLMMAVFLLSAPPVANAQVILTAFDAGWYDDTGAHTPSNSNYATGYDGPTFRQYRNWFLFSLPGGSPPITSAALRIYNPASPPYAGNGYNSPDPTETFQLRDVSTPFFQLTAGGNGQTAIYADLGTGTDYGSRVYSAADNGSYADIPFSAAAVGDLNAAMGGFFAVGGSISTLAGTGTQNIFAFSNFSIGAFPPRMVITTVPEPSSLVLATMSLAVAFRSIRRKRSG